MSRRRTARSPGQTEKGLTSWTQPGAVDQTEWVDQIRTVSTCCADSPYYIQESLHPNYWAQLATRSRVRQAWNGGSPRGGSCSTAGTGLVGGEPVMALKLAGADVAERQSTRIGMYISSAVSEPCSPTSVVS